MAKGQKLPHPGGHVTIRVGRPFRLADVLPPGTDRRTAKGLATTLIMERIAALLPALAAGHLRPPSAAAAEVSRTIRDLVTRRVSTHLVR